DYPPLSRYHIRCYGDTSRLRMFSSRGRSAPDVPWQARDQCHGRTPGRLDLLGDLHARSRLAGLNRRRVQTRPDPQAYNTARKSIDTGAAFQTISRDRPERTNGYLLPAKLDPVPARKRIRAARIP